MTVENTNAPRKRSPLEDFLAERTLEVRSDLRDLFATLEGDELLEAVIERIQRYAIETLGDSERENFRRYKSPHMLGTIRETFSEELTEWISNFISDAHREFIVRCHARGIATVRGSFDIDARRQDAESLGTDRCDGDTQSPACLSYTVGISETGDRTVAREEIRRNLARGSGTA